MIQLLQWAQGTIACASDGPVNHFAVLRDGAHARRADSAPFPISRCRARVHAPVAPTAPDVPMPDVSAPHHFTPALSGGRTRSIPNFTRKAAT